MRRKVVLLRVLLAVTVTFDLLLMLQVRRHGWPAILSGQFLGDGRMEISVRRIPFSAWDWLVAILLVAIQGAIVYGNWRIGRTVRRQH